MGRAERFFKIVNSLGMTNYDLYAKMDLVPRSTVYRWTKGECEPTPRSLEPFFERYPNVNKEYVWEGTGPMFLDTGKTTDTIFELRRAIKTASDTAVPTTMVSIKSVTSFVESLYGAKEKNEDMYSIVPRLDEDLTNGKWMVFEVGGDSMLPTILNGTKVLAEKVDESRWEYVNGVVVMVYGKQMVIKRVLYNDLFAGGSITLSSDDARFGSFSVQRAGIRAIYKVKRKVDEDVL